jgi:hypothetical protein
MSGKVLEQRFGPWFILLYRAVLQAFSQITMQLTGPDDQVLKGFDLHVDILSCSGATWSAKGLHQGGGSCRIPLPDALAHDSHQARLAQGVNDLDLSRGLDSPG